jgi:hypothetical protein
MSPLPKRAIRSVRLRHAPLQPGVRTQFLQSVGSHAEAEQKAVALPPPANPDRTNLQFRGRQSTRRQFLWRVRASKNFCGRTAAWLGNPKRTRERGSRFLRIIELLRGVHPPKPGLKVTKDLRLAVETRRRGPKECFPLPVIAPIGSHSGAATILVPGCRETTHCVNLWVTPEYQRAPFRNRVRLPKPTATFGIHTG